MRAGDLAMLHGVDDQGDEAELGEASRVFLVMKLLPRRMPTQVEDRGRWSLQSRRDVQVCSDDQVWQGADPQTFNSVIGGFHRSGDPMLRSRSQ